MTNAIIYPNDIDLKKIVVRYKGSMSSWLGAYINIASQGYDLYINDKLVTDVAFPDGIVEVGKRSFANCYSLASVTIPDSVTSIGGSAFYNCTSLTSITIPDSVTSIDKYAFFNCTSLDKVYYNGTANEWSKISIDTYNDDLISAARYYYSDTQPTTSGNFWHYVDGKVTEW